MQRSRLRSWRYWGAESPRRRPGNAVVSMMGRRLYPVSLAVDRLRGACLNLP